MARTLCRPCVARTQMKLERLASAGMTAMIVEQDITKALSVSSRVYCLQEGRVSLEGASGTVSREEISRAYFGID